MHPAENALRFLLSMFLNGPHKVTAQAHLDALDKVDSIEVKETTDTPSETPKLGE